MKSASVDRPRIRGVPTEVDPRGVGRAFTEDGFVPGVTLDHGGGRPPAHRGIARVDPLDQLAVGERAVTAGEDFIDRIGEQAVGLRLFAYSQDSILFC